MPEETKLVTLLREREECEKELLKSRAAVVNELAPDFQALDLLESYSRSWRKFLCLEKQIAVEEVLRPKEILPRLEQALALIPSNEELHQEFPATADAAAQHLQGVTSHLELAIKALHPQDGWGVFPELTLEENMEIYKAREAGYKEKDPLAYLKNDFALDTLASARAYLKEHRKDSAE